MGTWDWINLGIYVTMVAATAPLAALIWKVTRRYPEMRSSFIVWCVLVGLASTVPIWIAITHGTGWYPGAVGGAVLLISVGHGIARRKAIARAFRTDGDGRPEGRP